MMKKVRWVDGDGVNSYSPEIKDALINTDDIVNVIPRNHPRRLMEPQVTISFRNGEKMIVLGRIEDFLPQ